MGHMAALGVGGPPVVAFVPTDITGLQLWLRADDIAQADNTAVSAWADQSGLGNNAAAAGGVEPTLQTSEVNGHSVVRFDGVNDVMTVTGITNNDATRTVIYAGKIIAFTSNDGVWGWSASASVDQGTTTIRYRLNAAAGSVTIGTPGVGTFHCGIVRFNSTSSADVYLNTAAATNFDPDDAYQSGALALALGARVAAGTNPGNIDLAEMLIYNVAITNTEKDSVVNYLKAKYSF